MNTIDRNKIVTNSIEQIEKIDKCIIELLDQNNITHNVATIRILSDIKTSTIRNIDILKFL